MATGRVVFACSARRSSMFTCGRFLYFHQSLPLTPHFHLCTKRVFGPSVLSCRAKLDDIPACTMKIRITVMIEDECDRGQRLPGESGPFVATGHADETAGHDG